MSRIWTMYTTKWWVPAKYAANPIIAKINSGFSVFFRFNSLKGCASASPLVWMHLTSVIRHSAHELANFLIESYSSLTKLSGTHPRNHRSDFNAALSCFLDNNHSGDSGTYGKKIPYGLVEDSDSERRRK